MGGRSLFRDPHAGPMVKGQLLAKGVRVISATESEYDPLTTSGLAIEKMTEFKNAAYSMDIAFHTHKGMKENISRRDQEIGFCYKNGGAAPWGFKAYKVQRGVNGRGAPIMKTLWDKNKDIVAETPIWAWVYHILIKLRLEQTVSYDCIRDFLNNKDIPAARKAYWGVSSIRSLLQPSALLQYAGYGVWNVHRKRGGCRPPSEWDIIENAHPAIITMKQAESINTVNERQSRISRDKSKSRMANVRSKGSRYILSGGLFVCKRCGANMVGFRNRGRLYYVCGANYYRKGLGCGEAFQVRKAEIEAAVIEEIGHLFTSLSDTPRLKDLMNRELKAQEVKESTDSAEIRCELERIAKETEYVRTAIRNGLDDVVWANMELRSLKEEEKELLNQLALVAQRPEPIRVDKSMVKKYQKAFAEVISCGTHSEKRKFTRLFMKQIDLNPDTGDILMHLYSRPSGLLAPKHSTPASNETGVPMCAGHGAQRQ